MANKGEWHKVNNNDQLRQGLCMLGGIYAHPDQKCPICGGAFKDNGKALICPNHPDQRATKFRVVFKNIHRRFGTYEMAASFLGGLRFENSGFTEREFDERDYQVRKRPLSFSQLADKWLAVKKQEVSASHWRNLRNYLGRAKEAWQDRNVKEIQYADIEDFLLEQVDLSPKTRNNIKSALHSFWVWLRKRRVITAVEMPDFPEVPFELGYRKLVDKKTQQGILEEVRNISWDINPKIYLGVKWLCTYVNVRPGELVKVKEGDILLDQGIILIPHPKEKKPKPVVLLDEDVEAIRGFPPALPHVPFFRHLGNVGRTRPGQPFGDKYFWKWWKKACFNLSIEDLDLYGGTRHSSATALQEHFSPEEIKEATMHGTNAAFQRYFRTDLRKVKAVYAKASKPKDEEKKESGKVLAGEFGK